MPRILKDERYWERIKLRPRRWYANTLPAFLDYFPEVEGTVPEKILFNALAARRVNFYFGQYFGDIPFTEDSRERYRPDFILPDYNIIIDVQGIYWHTRPGKYESDYFRAVLLEAAQWKVYLLTDAEILANPFTVLDKIPELVSPHITGTTRIIADRPISPLAPLLARIKRRPKIVNTKFARTRKDRVKPLASWQRSRRPKYVTEYGPLFESQSYAPEYIAQLREYGQQWREYIRVLGDFFAQYPEAAGYYPDEFRYWNKWRDWWNRFRSSPL